jgi:18S rRNA (guanine1575-N7)-methyltransferase
MIGPTTHHFYSYYYNIMSRPEGTRAPQDYYDDTEARKYNDSSRIINIQADITNRAIQMLSLPPDKSCYILDGI